MTTTTRTRAPWLCAAALLIADQATKWASATTRCGAVICPMRNHVLMLGLGGPAAPNTLAVGLGGLVLVVVWVMLMARRALVPPIATAAIVAGVVSNLCDRLVLGSVRDFFAIPGHVLINLADAAIFAGLLTCSIAVARQLMSDRPTVERR